MGAWSGRRRNCLLRTETVVRFGTPLLVDRVTSKISASAFASWLVGGMKWLFTKSSRSSLLLEVGVNQSNYLCWIGPCYITPIVPTATLHTRQRVHSLYRSNRAEILRTDQSAYSAIINGILWEWRLGAHIQFILTKRISRSSVCGVSSLTSQVSIPADFRYQQVKTAMEVFDRQRLFRLFEALLISTGVLDNQSLF